MVIPSFGSLDGFSLPAGISRVKFFNRLAKIKKFSPRATDSPRHFRRPEKKISRKNAGNLSYAHYTANAKDSEVIKKVHGFWVIQLKN